MNTEQLSCDFEVKRYVFATPEEAESFRLKCYFNGDKCSYPRFRNGVYEVTCCIFKFGKKKNPTTMKAGEMIIANRLDTFYISFFDAVGNKIENANLNIVGDMIVQKCEIDYTRQVAYIYLVTI